ncbi:MAG: DNA cytosine methyltransferase [Sedimentisphaerales bacterium]|nr:DNA cytosine methyltransferase [Sedimentisphaerales bacterium]
MKDGCLVLSLFPGIDLLGRAFEEHGFCVVRGPDVIFGGDVRGWHVPAGRFDGVIGGPPCQCFSSLRHIASLNGHEPRFGNLIPEFERVCAEAKPRWWLMEEVPGAPLPAAPGYAAWSCLLDNRQLGEAQRRIRRWTFGVPGPRYHVLMIDTVPLMNPRFEYTACGGHGGTLAQVDRRRARKPGSVLEYRHSSSLPGQNCKTEAAFRKLKHLQGLPDDYELPGWRVDAKCRAVGNGVPMAMGRALAKAVKEAMKYG